MFLQQLFSGFGGPGQSQWGSSTSALRSVPETQQYPWTCFCRSVWQRPQAWFDFYTWIWFLTANNPPFWCPNKRYQTENFRLVSKCQFVGLRTPFILPNIGTFYAIPSESGSSWLPSTAAEHIWGVLHRLVAAWRDDMGWPASKIHPFWWRKHEETREPKDLNHVFFLGGAIVQTQWQWQRREKWIIIDEPLFSNTML